MHSQPPPTAADTPTMAAPPAAARARVLHRPRPPRLRPTRDPRTLWRDRETAWTTLPWPVLCASLPKAAAAPFTNYRGEPHPCENTVGLDWPADGVLTNAERRTWNRLPLTSTDSDRILHPHEIATALHATLEESALGAPKHWDVGATTLGEWWTLRARYAEPANRRRPEREHVETVITTRYFLGAPRVVVQSGLHLPRNGAEIIAGISYMGVLRHERITVPNNRGYDLVTTLANQARATAAVLASWTEEALLRPALASWAGTVATPAFGHSTAARLIALHDRQRFSAGKPPDERPAPMDTACDVAWILADHLRSVPDIDARTEQQNRIIKAVSELCWWNEREEATEGYAESVH